MYRPRIETLEDRKLFSVTTAPPAANPFNGTQGGEIAYKAGAPGSSSLLPCVEQDGLCKFSASISVGGAQAESVGKDEKITIGENRSAWHFILPSGDLLVGSPGSRHSADSSGLRLAAVDRVMVDWGDGQADAILHEDNEFSFPRMAKVSGTDAMVVDPTSPDVVYVGGSRREHKQR